MVLTRPDKDTRAHAQHDAGKREKEKGQGRENQAEHFQIHAEVRRHGNSVDADKRIDGEGADGNHSYTSGEVEQQKGGEDEALKEADVEPDHAGTHAGAARGVT